MEINIKLADKKDYNQIVKIYQESFSEPPYNENWTISDAKRKIKIFSRYCEIYSVFFGEEIVGFFILNPFLFKPGTTVFGEEIAIKKEMRNKGIGRKCNEWIKREFKKRGFKKFIFMTLKDANAYKYYKNWGFKESQSDVLMEVDLN